MCSAANCGETFTVTASLTRISWRCWIACCSCKCKSWLLFCADEITTASENPRSNLRKKNRGSIVYVLEVLAVRFQLLLQLQIFNMFGSSYCGSQGQLLSKDKHRVLGLDVQETGQLFREGSSRTAIARDVCLSCNIYECVTVYW